MFYSVFCYIGSFCNRTKLYFRLNEMEKIYTVQILQMEYKLPPDAERDKTSITSTCSDAVDHKTTDR